MVISIDTLSCILFIYLCRAWTMENMVSIMAMSFKGKQKDSKVNRNFEGKQKILKENKSFKR